MVVIKKENDADDTYEPSLKRSCVRLRASLAKSTAPRTKFKPKDDEGPEWKPGASLDGRKKPPPPKEYTGRRKPNRTKEEIRAARLEVERARKERLREERRLNKSRAPMEKQMRDLGVLKCPLCDLPQSSFWAIGQHFQDEHKLYTSSRYINCCEHRQYKDRVWDHMRYHGQMDLFKCAKCGELCLSGHDLQKHQRAKHAEKGGQMICIVCSRKYVSEEQLRKHAIRVHSPKIAIQCKDCGKGIFNNFFFFHPGNFDYKFKFYYYDVYLQLSTQIRNFRNT